LEGVLDVDWDSDVWADHDENCHGPIDTQENQHNHPEGFIWTCCDKFGDEPGCRRGRHKSVKDRRGPHGEWDCESSSESVEEDEEEDDSDEEEEGE
jgi:hypothetical protein